MNSLKRIIQESIIIAENIQQADKIYFKTGLLSPNVRRHIVHITEGDAWTKLLTDIYYTEMIKWKKNSHWAVGVIGGGAYKEPESESEYHTPGVDDMMGLEDWKRMRRFHNQLKIYNKNVFPIAGLNANGVKDVWDLIRSLNEREKILIELKKLPSIAIRNMKNEIREARDSSQLKKYRELLEYFTAQYASLSNRSGRIKANIEKKMFKSGVTLDDLVDFADEKENLIGGKKLNKIAIKKIIKENSYDLNIIYDKGDKMVVEVTGQNGIKKIGCNSVWCFTYGAGVYNNRGDWYNNSTNDCVYVFIDFSEQSDSPYFMYVLVKPIDWNSEYSDEDGDSENHYKLANMSNEYNDNPIGVITHFMPLEVAKKLLNFGEEPEEPEEEDYEEDEEDNEDTFEEKPEPEYQDPNQLKLDLKENKNIKSNFSNLDLDDIDFDSKVSYGHMSLKLVFTNPDLNNFYNKLMEKDFRVDGTYLDLETKNMNHIHINAIPYSLRNIGLGKLIYKKILQEIGYITTGFVNARISEEAERVWNSLINSGEYYYFKSKNNSRVTLAEKYGNVLVYEHILDYYGEDLAETNFDKSEISVEDLNENLNKIRRFVRAQFLNEAKKSKFEKLEDNKVPLTDEERKTVMDADAIWHHGPGGKPSPAVWKSKDKNGKITYVTNTHRAYQDRPTLKGAISIYHSFIKGTA